MTTTDQVLAKAHEYGEAYFHPSPLTATEIYGRSASLGRGYESWLVRIESRQRAIIVSVISGPDGNTEVTHHTQSVA